MLILKILVSTFKIYNLSESRLFSSQQFNRICTSVFASPEYLDTKTGSTRKRDEKKSIDRKSWNQRLFLDGRNIWISIILSASVFWLVFDRWCREVRFQSPICGIPIEFHW